MILAAGLVTAAIGVVAERLLLRRLYDHSEETMLLATYALC